MQNTVVTIEDLKTLIKTRFAQNVKFCKTRPRAIYIEGHAGIGKTDIVRQCAQELSVQMKEPIDFMILNLQFMERPDFMGLAYVDHEHRTRFATPGFLPQTGHGILLLDEVNRVDQDIRSGLLTLLQDREINGNKVGDGWLIVLAGNPGETADGEGKYEVNELDTALLDRMSKLILKPSVDSLIQYLEKKYSGEDPLVQLLKKAPSLISFNGSGISPRTFEYLIRSLQGVIDHNLRKIIVATEVGVEASHKINLLMTNTTAGYHELLGSEDIEKDIKFQKLAEKQEHQAFLMEELLKDFDQRLISKKLYTEREKKNIFQFLSLLTNEMKMSLMMRVKTGSSARQFFDTFVKGTQLAFKFSHLTAVRAH